MAHQPTIVEAASVGIDAFRVVRSGARGRISAVFERSFYAAFGDDWICFGGPSIGNGPLNVVLRGAWAEAKIDSAPGDEVAVGYDGGTDGSTWDVRLGNASVWRPSTTGQWSPRGASQRIASLSQLLPDGLPEEGLACFLRHPRSPRSLAARAAAPSVDAMAKWAASPCGETEALTSAVRDLIGLGPGLTPSGDDFLAGFLAALRAIGRDEKADALWRIVQVHAPGRTNAISLSHLRAAAAGRLCEPLHRVMAALLPETPDNRLDIDCWPDLGHTSPWDGLAGVVTALAASLPEDDWGYGTHGH